MLITFRTMLDLLQEYPDFHVSHSQAAAYHIVHFFLCVLLPVNVPALGYSTYIMTEKAGDMSSLTANDFYLTCQNLPPVELYTFVLENELLKAVLDVRIYDYLINQ